MKKFDAELWAGFAYPLQIAAKERLEKANPYHDERGRFTSANNAVGGRGGKGKKPKLKRGGGKKKTDKGKGKRTVKVEPFSPRKISDLALVSAIGRIDAFHPHDPEEIEATLQEHQDQLDSLGEAEPYPSGHKMTEYQKDCVDIVSYSWINDFSRGQTIRARAAQMIDDKEIDYYADEKRLGKTENDITWARLGLLADSELAIATTIQAIREAPKSVVWRGLRLTAEAASKLVKGAIHEESIATATGRKNLAEQFTFGRWMNPNEARRKPVRVLLKIKGRNIPIGESPVNTPKQVKSLVNDFLFGSGDTQPLVAFADERFISGRYRITSKPTLTSGGLLIVEMEEISR